MEKLTDYSLHTSRCSMTSFHEKLWPTF